LYESEAPWPHRHHVALPEEHVGLAELDLAVHFLRRVQRDEQRLAVGLDLRPLVRVVRVLDREIVQAELLLQLHQQLLARLVQPDPEERVRLLQHVRDLLELDRRHALALRVVRHAVHHHGLGGRGRGREVHAAGSGKAAQ
jgi:hypothetical protein